MTFCGKLPLNSGLTDCIYRENLFNFFPQIFLVIPQSVHIFPPSLRRVLGDELHTGRHLGC